MNFITIFIYVLTCTAMRNGNALLANTLKCQHNRDYKEISDFCTVSNVNWEPNRDTNKLVEWIRSQISELSSKRSTKEMPIILGTSENASSNKTKKARSSTSTWNQKQLDASILSVYGFYGLAILIVSFITGEPKSCGDYNIEQSRTELTSEIVDTEAADRLAIENIDESDHSNVPSSPPMQAISKVETLSSTSQPCKLEKRRANSSHVRFAECDLENLDRKQSEIERPPSTPSLEQTLFPIGACFPRIEEVVRRYNRAQQLPTLSPLQEYEGIPTYLRYADYVEQHWSTFLEMRKACNTVTNVVVWNLNNCLRCENDPAPELRQQILDTVARIQAVGEYGDFSLSTLQLFQKRLNRLTKHVNIECFRYADTAVYTEEMEKLDEETQYMVAACCRWISFYYSQFIHVRSFLLIRYVCETEKLVIDFSEYAKLSQECTEQENPHLSTYRQGRECANGSCLKPSSLLRMKQDASSVPGPPEYDDEDDSDDDDSSDEVDISGDKENAWKNHSSGRSRSMVSFRDVRNGLACKWSQYRTRRARRHTCC